MDPRRGEAAHRIPFVLCPCIALQQGSAGHSIAVAASQAKEIRHYILFTCMMDVAATAHKNEMKSNQIV
jgi:hypothetical protein